MVSQSTCPEASLLERFTIGATDETDSTIVESHLSWCRHCLGLVSDMRTVDPLVDAVRIGARKQITPGEDYQDLMQVARGLKRQIRSHEYDDSAEPKADNHRAEDLTSSESADVARIYHFDPPRYEDEIGRLGDYRITKLLGVGGMGAVFLAQHIQLKRWVALKMLLTKRALNPNYLSRFRREGEVLARLRHPHIVQIYEIAEHEGRPYLVLEYLAGGSLATWLRGEPQPIPICVPLVAELARTIHHAHQHGIIHRDLKPANVLLEVDPLRAADRRAADEHAGREHSAVFNFKVTDFGLARQLEDQAITQTGDVLGTPGYMAPELTTGHTGASEAGPAADVYSLGAILYELTTGRPPFRGETAWETLQQTRHDDPLPLQKLRPGTPRDLQTICLKCLAKNPAERYPTANDVADDLVRFLSHEPIHARPAGIQERLRKWVRRNPAWATLTLVSVLSFLAAVIGIVGHNVRLNREVLRAEAGEDAANRQKLRVDAQYAQARTTLQRVLEKLQQPGAASIPQLTELRRQQLQEALGFYESVLVQDEPNPAVRLDLALAYYQISAIQASLGESESAENSAQRAVGMLERLLDEANVAAHAAGPAASHYLAPDEYRAHLADCLNTLGNVQANLGRIEDGERQLSRALEIAKALVAHAPDRADWQDAVGHTYQNLGALHHRTGRDPKQFYEEGLAIRLVLVRNHPENRKYAAAAAGGYINLGLCYQGEQNPEQAEKAYQGAQTLLEPLVSRHPEDRRYASLLASAFVNWGMLLKDTARPEAAIERYDNAIKIANGILAVEPNFASAKLDLLNAHGGRAQALGDLKRYEEALTDWDRVIELSDDTSRSTHRLGRAMVLLSLGSHAEIASEAEAFAHEYAAEGDMQYNAACLFARAAAIAADDTMLESSQRQHLAGRYAGQAIDILRALYSSGYFDNTSRIANLHTDSDLESLRGLEQFQSLLREIDK